MELTINNQNINDMLLQQAASITYNFELQQMNAYQNFDNLVDLEMQRIKAQNIHEEEHYVEQMLQEQPVIVDRRPASNQKPSSSSDETVAVAMHSSDTTAKQRAESCRKSRINNKIKMAKTKFRHKYISSKLAQSANNLDCLRNVIAQTEAKLLLSGYDQSLLQNLRNTFGVDRN